MKVKSVHIQNFKQFDNLELSFENELLGEISDRFLILGDNGSGKTTILQAIALPLCPRHRTHLLHRRIRLDRLPPRSLLASRRTPHCPHHHL